MTYPNLREQADREGWIAVPSIPLETIADSNEHDSTKS